MFWVDVEPFQEILDRVRGAPDVGVTFDDGHCSDIEIAMPELLKRGMKGVFFVVTGRINQQGFLSESDIRELHREGMSIGSHGESHVEWTGLSPDALQKEVVGSKATLEEVVGEAVTSAACPFGAYDRASLTTLRERGFRSVHTSDRGLCSRRDWLRARNTVLSSNDMQALEEWLRIRPWGMAENWRRLKRIVKARR